MDLDLKNRLFTPITPTGSSIDKTMMQLDTIQDRLKQHPVLLV